MPEPKRGLLGFSTLDEANQWRMRALYGILPMREMDDPIIDPINEPPAENTDEQNERIQQQDAPSTEEGEPQ